MMNTLLEKQLPRLTLGEARQFRNLTVVPLFAGNGDGPEYLTLKEALEKNLLEVGEVSQAGSVPDLLAINRADLPVLLVDGEELMGAKQNRLINASILLKEKATTQIPVSCSERGRWSYRTAHFGHSGYVAAHKLRMLKSDSVSKSLKSTGTYHSDQWAVWAQVDKYAAETKAWSPTRAMKDVFDVKLGEMQKFLDAFPPLPDQKGLAVLINGTVAGVELFSRTQAYRELHPTLLKSYAMDALLEPAEVTGFPAVESVQRFLDEAAQTEEHVFPSVGYGQNHRYESRAVSGAALVHQDTVIHLALFRMN